LDAIRLFWRKLRVDTRGATAIEYGLIAALIAIACVGGLKSLSGKSGGMWDRLSNIVTDPSKAA
jgi:pilus assembly protein Flp/PilA